MNTREIIASLKENKTYPKFAVGDTVKVHVKIKEGEKERVQVFEGVVIHKKGKSAKESMFTVRKMSYGIGVERMFPTECSAIESLEVVKQGKARRARLYYLRNLSGRAAVLDEVDTEMADASREETANSKVKTSAAASAAAL